MLVLLIVSDMQIDFGAGVIVAYGFRYLMFVLVSYIGIDIWCRC